MSLLNAWRRLSGAWHCEYCDKHHPRYKTEYVATMHDGTEVSTCCDGFVAAIENRWQPAGPAPVDLEKWRHLRPAGRGPIPWTHVCDNCPMNPLICETRYARSHKQPPCLTFKTYTDYARSYLIDIEENDNNDTKSDASLH